MLFGSKSKNLEEPVLPVKKLEPPPFVSCALVSLLKGTPSTTKRAWLLPLKELKPLTTTLVAEPDIPPAAVICTPDALPDNTRATSPSERDSKSFSSTDDTA